MLKPEDEKTALVFINTSAEIITPAWLPHLQLNSLAMLACY